MTSPRLPQSLVAQQARVTTAIGRLLPSEGLEPRTVHGAMRYTALAPSKRVRAAVTVLAAELCGRANDGTIAVAASIELVHSASLILDDLPSMDNAPLRRGKPACHVAFGEAVAVLAAFGLLNLAFSTVARGLDPVLAARVATLIADAIGSDGLIAGQAEDLAATEREISFETLERIHRRKTGALFSAAAVAGALTAGAPPSQIAALEAYAKNLGLAFQIVDDLLDVEGDPAETGKATRTDLKKTTFVSFSGVDGARQLAGELCATADAALAPFGARAEPLRQLSAFVAARRG
ncbi:MAG TPA: polyprenyl synthetase family protein [Vicinamibacterales bacterium]|jgi:geranylgeranyl pyrophosphate synthase|nr:polyprenyl synthetase family protein [Vicinamibacterales bacterium]